MAKKTKKQKEVARLRREVETLRAQLSRQPTASPRTELRPGTEAQPPESKTSPSPQMQRVDPKFIKADLIRAAVLTLVSLVALALLYIFRNWIPFF